MNVILTPLRPAGRTVLYPGVVRVSFVVGTTLLRLHYQALSIVPDDELDLRDYVEFTVDNDGADP
jgi:hypothetical protein